MQWGRGAAGKSITGEGGPGELVRKGLAAEGRWLARAVFLGRWLNKHRTVTITVERYSHDAAWRDEYSGDPGENRGGMLMVFSYFFSEVIATIRVVVTGAAGRMGREMTRGLLQTEDIAVVGAVDRREVGVDIGSLNGLPPAGVVIQEDLAGVIASARPEVMVDFTVAAAALANARLAVEQGVSPVIGTTGISLERLDELHQLCEARQVGAVVAPNFSLGAILMMHFAEEAARYFPRAEIIEIHHDQKIDAPSGTALKTAELMAARVNRPLTPSPAEEKVAGARGATYQGLAVHSVRLPGAVAHQEVIFGGQGQLLTIRHDTTSREAFLPGLLLAIKKVRQLKGVVYGLENLLEF
ncbi:dihydrodipicolinate reductase [Moorella thermoacetica Y72]|uniref:4-hydroxy-tetrahydrodipicolinate reductase n=2 Tax=Neomoorella thermoacetica TaxID=1525 RepID=A0A0S6UGX4_NEOTH|nr:dihydrodipicolinate reductase [Moorella thermoacetica Y72]